MATIGQDYFDIDLLAYDRAFPLGDAYRVELGVDAGAGPRRFTLFFIPPRTKRHTYPNDYPMSAEMCMGAARIAIAEGCIAAAGAEAVYFGSDQPRITAEMVDSVVGAGDHATFTGNTPARRDRHHLLGR